MDTFLSVKEVAEFFKRSPVTIYKWIKRGWIKPLIMKVGGSNFYEFTIDSLVAFFNNQMNRAEIHARLEGLRKQENVCPWNNNNPPRQQ